MQRTMEDATGLSVDFQVAFPDAALKDAVDNVLKGIEIKIPDGFDTSAFFLDGVKYPEGHFETGIQAIDGFKTMQFMKALPTIYSRETERNVRKGIVLQAMLQKVQTELANPGFWWRTLNFLSENLKPERVNGDLNIAPILFNTLKHLMTLAVKANISNIDLEKSIPEFGKTLYIVDPASGDGGVRWARGNQSPAIQQDLRENVFPTEYFAVPAGNINPYADDLVEDYWQAVRDLVKERLTSFAP